MLTSEKLEFSGHSGHRLAAVLDRPLGPLRAVALFAHCFTCTKDIVATRLIARQLAGHGIAVLRFDFTGLGHSDGEFANTHFSSNVDDLLAAARHLAALDMPPQLLIGHSLGGAAVLKAAPQIESVQAVVTIGAPADPSHVAHLFESDRDQIERSGRAEVLLAGRPFTITRGFIDDIEQASLQQAQREYRGALRVLHAPLDATVGIDNAQEIFMAARHPKSFVCLDGADHLLTRRHDAEYAADVISAWALKYLPPTALEKPIIDEGEVLAVERGSDGYTQDIFAGQQHHLVSDEPASLGGSDLGPSPYQLLGAGLASCTAITLRMYARHKRIGLDGVAVRVVHHKQHLTDCQDCTDHPRQVDVFERLIRLDGDLSDAERDRMLQIANRCPVHNTLQKTARVESRLLDD